MNTAQRKCKAEHLLRDVLIAKRYDGTARGAKQWTAILDDLTLGLDLHLLETHRQQIAAYLAHPSTGSPRNAFDVQIKIDTLIGQGVW